MYGVIFDIWPHEVRNHSPDILQHLHDIQAPTAPGWWPPAPGWWFVMLSSLLLPLLVPKLWRYQRCYWQRRRRIRALDALSHRRDLDDAQFAAAVSQILKRAALSHYQRDQVAALYGRDWLAFLDAQMEGQAFSQGCGQVLACAPYQAQAQVDRSALSHLARRWLQQQG
jgi:hypothetical protein